MGSASEQFSVIFFFFEKKKSLKHLKLPKNHFKTNSFFSIFGGGDPPPVRSWSDGRLELQTSLEKTSDTSQITVSCRICFIACRSFSIFFIFSVKGDGWVGSGA